MLKNIVLILFVSMLVLYFVKSDQGVVVGSNTYIEILTNIEKEIGQLKIKNGYLQSRIAEFKSNYFNVLLQQNLNATIDLFEEDHVLDPYGIAILTKIEESLRYLKETSSFQQLKSKEQIEFKSNLLKLCNNTCISQQNLFNKEIHALRDDLQNQYANNTKDILFQIARTVDNAQKSLQISQQNLFDKEIHALRDDLQNQYANNIKEVLFQLARTANKTQESIQQNVKINQKNVFDKEIQALRDDLENQLDSLRTQSTNNTNEVLFQYRRDLQESILNLKDMIKEINKILEEYPNSQLTKLTMQYKFPETCTEALGNSSIPGIYQVLLPTDLRSVYCNENGWLLIQRQFDGPLSFYRNWLDYRNGFGHPNGQYWLGLETLREITMQKRHELFILMTDFENIKTFARYDDFLIGSEVEKYKLEKLGTFSANGSTTDRLKFQLNMKFSTFDSDNDLSKDLNCAKFYGSGWWYEKCFKTNLNQNIWRNSTDLLNTGLFWEYKSFLKEVAMYIKLY